MGKILLIIGIIGMVLGGAAAIIALILPKLTRNVSNEEGIIGLLVGLGIFALSFTPAVIGLIIILVKRKKAA